MTISPVDRRQLVDDVVAVLAADQDAAVRAGVADALRWLAALQLRRRAVREIRQVALSGVDDQHAGRPGRGEHLGQRRDHLLQLADVVAEGFAEPAGQQEVSLHVDHDEGAVLPTSSGNGPGTAATVARWSLPGWDVGHVRLLMFSEQGRGTLDRSAVGSVAEDGVVLMAAR